MTDQTGTDPTAGGRHRLSGAYEVAWVRALDMGPHPLWQLEDLLPALALGPGDRVLDLGCGRGASSVFLARETGARIVAADLWVDEADLRSVVEAAGVGNRVEVVPVDARSLPFADREFDAIVSVDAFEYFGTDVHLLPGLLRVLRPGGRIAISTPALGIDPYDAPPPGSVTDLVGWEAAAWHSPAWWQRHWELTGLLDDVTARMQPGGRDDWLRWAAGDDAPAARAVVDLLTGLGPGDIGFALVTATKVDRS